MVDRLVEITRYLPYALAAIGLALLLLLVVVWVLARRASHAPWPVSGGLSAWIANKAADARAYLSSASLRRSFDAARRNLGAAAPGGRGLYALPWCLLIGQARAGKSTLAALGGLDLPYGEPPAAAAGEPPCRFWLYHEGVVLDLAGDLVLRADGRTSNEDAWRAVLQLIARERPRRPLDAVMLALPATALAGRGGSGELDHDFLNDAARRAAVLYRKLWQVQDAAGLRLPVYVTVTESDLLPGFSAFCDLLPAAARGQLFGWSAPDTAGTAYSPSWVDRLFAQLLDSLDQDLVEVLGSRATTAGNEEAFQIARSLAALREPVRIYLNQIFSPSANHEVFAFRGLYFTAGRFAAAGAARAVAPAVVPRDAEPVPAGGAHGDAHPVGIDFARDLLAVKAFPEAPLGRPTAAALRAGRRTRRWLQAGLAATLLLAGFGLPAAGRATAARAGRLLGFDREIQRDLDRPRARHGVPATRRLLVLANQLDGYTLRSLLLPASWLSPLDGEQRRAAARAYHRIALPAVRWTLDGRLGALGAATRPPPQTCDAAPRAYPQTAEFQRLSAFTADLGTAESRVAAFNCIARVCTGRASKLVGDLDQLTRWAFNASFQPPSWDAGRFYGAVLGQRGAAPIPYPPDGGGFGLHQRAVALDRAVHHRLFDFNAVVGDLDALTAELRQLDRWRDSITGAGSYQRLLDLIDKTRRDLAAPEDAWMAAPALALGAPYDQVLAAVAGSRFLGPQLAADRMAAARTGFQRMKTHLAAYESPYAGPLLARQDGQLLLKLGPGLLQLEKALKGLLGQAFMTPVAGWPSAPPGGRSVLLWNANLLQQAQGEMQPLQDFLKQGLPLFPAALQPQVTLVARTSTREQMVSTIGRAEQWQPQPAYSVPELLQTSLDGQLASFQTAAPLLGPLAAALAALGFPDDAAQLSAQVDRERRAFLEQLEALLALENLYSTADPSFSWWDGKPGLAFGAFGVADDAGLGAYLDSQRQAVTSLAERYAAPMLAASGALPQLDGGVAARWRALVADLDAYKIKKAGSPLQALESLITPALEQTTVGTCLGQISAGGTRVPGDYFSARRDELARGARDRCLQLLRRDARGAYDQLAQIFQRGLAGRFPFSDAEPPCQEQQAQPAAIAGFYAAFDATLGIIVQVPRGDPAFGARYDEVQGFLKQMKEVRQLFAPYLDTPQQYPVPTLGFNAEFRVNRAGTGWRDDRAGEPGDDEIFLWRLAVGDTSLELGGAASSGRWSYRVPTTLTLGWAKDSPDVPAAVEASRGGVIEGRSVIYRYDCPWGLLALLRANPAAAGDFQHPEDNRPETLKLLVRTHADPPLPLAETKESKAFVRIALTTPDGKTPLSLPRFPARAPLLGD